LQLACGGLWLLLAYPGSPGLQKALAAYCLLPTAYYWGDRVCTDNLRRRRP
jgi:hypothetical protein